MKIKFRRTECRTPGCHGNALKYGYCSQCMTIEVWSDNLEQMELDMIEDEANYQ